MNKNKIVFTFATAEVNFIGQIFIKITELLTGKLKLKKLYDEYLSENRPPELFWDDAVDKLNFNLITNFQDGSYIPKKGKLIVPGKLAGHRPTTRAANRRPLGWPSCWPHGWPQ